MCAPAASTERTGESTLPVLAVNAGVHDAARTCLKMPTPFRLGMLCYPWFGRKCGWTLLMLASVLVAPLSWGQDITVGPIARYPMGAAPDELPKAVKITKPDYPADMSKTAEVGYVIVVRNVDEEGDARGVWTHSTHLPFERAVEASFYQWKKWKVTPARRGNVAVNSWIWTSFIFNPKVAKPDAPVSVPRLLAVDLAILPAGAHKPDDTFFVPVKFSLDETGAITQSKVEGTVEAPVLAAIESAVKNWRFAPARQNGQAIPAEITLGVFCMSPRPKSTGKFIPPKLLKAEQPEYPRVMAKFGVNGLVTTEFVIDVNGQIINPVIVASDNPAFDEPALEALFKWKFSPGQIDGIKVKVLVSQGIEFAMNDGGRSLFELRARGDQSKLPPELRYDTPARIRGIQIPVYPYGQLKENIRGKVEATMLVNPQGQVAAVKIRKTDQPEFAAALTAALERFSFDPALKDGRPTNHLINFDQQFDPNELYDQERDKLMSLEKNHPEKIMAASLLDLPLQPISTRPPVFPASLREKSDTGEAAIEFLIDEKGRVRLPRVISASEPAFGYAAVQAVSAWWFQPPLINGKAVITRARVPINFKPASQAVDAAESAPAK